MKAQPVNPGMTIDTLATELEGVLGAMTRVYELLLQNAIGHREALRKADPQAVAACAAEQGRLLHLIAEEEEKRQMLMNAASSVVVIERTGRALTMSDLARHTREPRRGRLMAMAERLRELISRASSELAMLKAAAGALVLHMEGVMRLIGRGMSHAGTYTRRGYVEAGGVVVSALDVRT